MWQYRCFLNVLNYINERYRIKKLYNYTIFLGKKPTTLKELEGRKGERADACLQKIKLTFIKIEQNKIIRNTTVIERDFGSMVSLIIENDLRHILGMKGLVYIVVPW